IITVTLLNLSYQFGYQTPLVSLSVYLALQNNRDLKIAYLQRILDQKQLSETESQFNPTFTPQLSLNLNNNQTGSNINNNTTALLGANFNLKIPTGGNLSLTWQGQNLLSRTSSLDTSSDTNTLSQSVNLNFSQPLLKGFGTGLNTLSIKRARFTENANILNIKNTISQTITNTIVSYRNLLLAQERLKIEQLSFANAKKDLDRLQALFEFGRIPKNDLVERQADIAQQEVNLLNTQSSLEQAISELTKTIDLPITKKLIAIETPTPPTSLNLPVFTEMLELAKANNTGYLAAVNAVENAKFGITEAKNQQQLDLKLNVSYGFNAASKVINAKERMRLSSNISMTDIINFEKSLVDTQNQELNAIINHLNSITQLEQLLGITTSRWVK
ncbi:MAG: TolC family protein, partial [Aphanizomenon sp.]